MQDRNDSVCLIIAKLIAFLIILGLTESFPTTNIDFSNNQNEVENGWPWNVLLITEIEGSVKRFCGGTLVNRHWVITVPACIRNYTTIYAVINIRNLSDIRSKPRNSLNRVTKTVVHDCSRPDSFTGVEIAMLRLSIPVNDAPACLPLSPVEDWSRLRRGAFLNKCVSIGFGSAERNKILSNTLQKRNYSVLSVTQCQRFYRNNVSEDKICPHNQAFRDTCESDIGGALLCRKSCLNCNNWYLVGLALPRHTRCQYSATNTQNPDVFMSVFAYMRWIETVMADQKPKENLRCGFSIFRSISIG